MKRRAGVAPLSQEHCSSLRAGTGVILRVILRVMLGVTCAVAVCVAFATAYIDNSVPTCDADEKDDAALTTGSRSPYVHRLTLYDHDGEAIDPADPDAPPYSPQRTCGKCHPYATINHGWHFAATSSQRPLSPSSPRGEPWFYVDRDSLTVIPISTRLWRGTFQPAELGWSRWEFLLHFGRHLTGGGFVDPTVQERDASDESIRWDISGSLEIDCMICHSNSNRYDPAEVERQIPKQNFRWIPTVALGLATVRGEARKVPDEYDPFEGPNPDFPEQNPPTVEYATSLFDGNDRVLFEVVASPPNERCYYCHTSREVAPQSGTPHPSYDVHIARGMSCSDCHHSGIDHDMVRGYRDESLLREDSSRAAYSCAGCHLGHDPLIDPLIDPAATPFEDTGALQRPANARVDATTRRGGSYGAPRPLHAGLPPIHLQKLSCTACHSGPLLEPGSTTARRVQTSLAHALGVPSKARRDSDLPHIYEPWFGRDSALPISPQTLPQVFPQVFPRVAPHRAVWPAFWGVRGEDNTKPDAITPLKIAQLGEVATILRENLPQPSTPSAALVTGETEDWQRVLSALSQGLEAEVVRIQQGSVWEWKDETLSRRDLDIAQPYTWPLAHDVRPARQSLGATGCRECHSRDGVMLNQPPPATYSARSVWPPDSAELLSSSSIMELWNRALLWRSVGKVAGWVCALVVACACGGVLFRSRRRPERPSPQPDPTTDSATK